MLAPENSPSWGGVGAYTFNLLKNIPADEIHVVTINREIEDSFDKILDDRFIIHKVTDINPKDSFFCNFKFQLALLNKLKNLNSQYAFDVIHSHSGHIPHLFAQFQNTAPIAVTVHATVRGLSKGLSSCKSKGSKTESLMKFFSLGIEEGEKIGFKKAALLLPVSNFTSQQITEDYGYQEFNKIKVEYNAVDTSLFVPYENENEVPLILFVGRLYAIKGLDTFLDALEILSKTRLNFKVRIVGRGDTKRVYERLSKLFEKDRFEILGRVTYFDMPAIYQQANILVVSSIYENCPTNILEAMSTRTLVIASSVGGIPEIINHEYNGFLYPRGNSVRLAELLRKTINNEIDCDKILKNAYNTILEKFTWKKRGEEIFNEYKKL
jgi:Glycosyltransferase